MPSERILSADETMLRADSPLDSYRALFLSLNQKNLDSLLADALAEFYEEGFLALSEERLNVAQENILDFKLKVFHRICSSYEQIFQVMTGHEIDSSQRDFQFYQKQNIRKIYTLEHPEVIALALKTAYEGGDFRAWDQEILLWIDCEINSRLNFYGSLS